MCVYTHLFLRMYDHLLVIVLFTTCNCVCGRYVSQTRVVCGMLRVVCKMDIDSERDAYRERIVILKSSTLRDMMLNNDIKLHHNVQGQQGVGAQKNKRDDCE